MGVINAREARIVDWTSRSVGAIWRAFDLQLATYAILLACFGLAMAYSNAVAGGDGALAGGLVVPAGLMWTGIALVVFTVAAAFDYHWLKTLVVAALRAPAGPAGLTLAIGTGVGGSSRWVSVLGLQFQFSEIAKILMIVILANFLGSRRGRLDSIWSILGACLLAAPPWILVMLQPDLGTSLVFAAILVGMLFIGGASLRWLSAMGFAVHGRPPVRLDVRPARLPEGAPDLVPGPARRTPRAPATSSTSRRSRSGPAAGSARASRTAPRTSSTSCRSRRPTSSSRSWPRSSASSAALVVIGLFVALLWRIMVAGWRSKDPFGTLFAAGLASMLLFQLFVNVGMVTGIMPITGIPLPVHHPRRGVADQHRRRAWGSSRASTSGRAAPSGDERPQSAADASRRGRAAARRTSSGIGSVAVGAGAASGSAPDAVSASRASARIGRRRATDRRLELAATRIGRRSAVPLSGRRVGRAR